MEYAQKGLDLTEGSIWRKIVIFALPILVGSLLQQLYTTVDAIIIGQFAGKNALAAIDAVYNLIKLPVNFFTGVSSGATIIISQYYGAKERERVSNASHTAILFAFSGGLLLSILGMLFAPFCLERLQVPDDIYQGALSYVRIYFAGMAVSMTYNIGAGIFRAVGNSKTPFYFLIAANITNVLLDVLFIAVFRWGVAGAALTTVLSQILSAFLVTIALVKTDLPCKIHLIKLRFHKAYLAEIISLGLPVGIQTTLYPLANMMIQSNINVFGTNSIAAWAVCGKLGFLIWLITDSLCTTISTFVAQNYGARKYERACTTGLPVCRRQRSYCDQRTNYEHPRSAICYLCFWRSSPGSNTWDGRNGQTDDINPGGDLCVSSFMDCHYCAASSDAYDGVDLLSGILGRHINYLFGLLPSLHEKFNI